MKLFHTVFFASTMLLGACAPRIAPQEYAAVVATDGSGDHTSVQAAIDAMPDGCTEPWRILIKNGTYEEWVYIPEGKRFAHLIGQDRDKTIISYRIHCGPEGDGPWEYSLHNKEANNGNTYGTVVVVDAPDFYAENLTIENRYGVEAQAGPQALALRTDNDRTALYNVSLRSFQDTWRTSCARIGDRTYALDCHIEGAVDYIFGAGEALFENCTLYNVRSGSVVVAPSHQPGTRWGYVFLDCTVDGNQAAADGRQLLGRPWHNSPIAVWINTTMRIPIAPEGWTDMGTIPKLFAECGSVDADGGQIDLTQRKSEFRTRDGRSGNCPTAITPEQATAYTYANIVPGDDGWNPRSYISKQP